MKRYLVFAFDNYYPAGGWEDFKGAFDTMDDAFNCAKAQLEDLYQVIDLEQMKEITKDFA